MLLKPFLKHFITGMVDTPLNINLLTARPDVTGMVDRALNIELLTVRSDITGMVDRALNIK